LNRVKLILICFSLILVGCSEDDPVSALTDAEILASFPGTYTMSGMADYPGGDCSIAADAVTGQCTTDEDITTEADCPVGMCFGDPELSETDCPDGDWFTGYCDSGVPAEFYTQESCEAAGEDWDHFGWMNYSDYMAEDGMTVTFLADGTFSEPDFICEDNDYNEIDAIDQAACEAAGGEVHTEQGIWTLSSSTLTLKEEPWCEDFEGVDIEPTDEAACLVANGEWLDDEVMCSGEISGDSFTCSMANDAECHTSGPEDGAEPANQADCDAADGYWEDANCMEFTFTKI